MFIGVGLPITRGAAPPASADPFAANVTSLLHLNGTNGQTTTTDTAPGGRAWTFLDTAQISTAQSRFGGASLALDGTTDFIQTTAGLAGFDFGSADFTLEMWIRPTAAPPANALIWSNCPDQAGQTGLCLFLTPGLQLNVFDYQAGNNIFLSQGLALNTWYHIAVSRQGTTFRFFINGTLSDTQTRTVSFQAVTACTIGAALAGTAGFTGFVDEVRVTKGVARYTGTFAAPTAQFPDP